jgi:hypothetical protein
MGVRELTPVNMRLFDSLRSERPSEGIINVDAFEEGSPGAVVFSPSLRK